MLAFLERKKEGREEKNSKGSVAYIIKFYKSTKLCDCTDFIIVYIFP